MIPRSFEYYAPSNLKDAWALLDKYRDDAKVLSGGHSLTPLMKLRLASIKYIVDISRIQNLSYIKQVGRTLKIGALTTHYTIESSDLIKKTLPILHDAARVIGDVQVRNMGTIGGSLAHNDPAADYPSTMLALGAEVEVTGSKGKRVIPMTKFLVDTFTTALKINEIVTEIRIPVPPPGSGSAYMKLERKAGDFAIVGVGAVLTLDAKGVCRNVGLGLGAVGATAIKPTTAEKALLGKTLSDEVIKEAAEKAAQESKPAADLRGSVEYKTDMVRVFTRRTLKLAASRAKGEM